jgi:hypothetical protein
MDAIEDPVFERPPDPVPAGALTLSPIEEAEGQQIVETRDNEGLSKMDPGITSTNPDVVRAWIRRHREWGLRKAGCAFAARLDEQLVGLIAWRPSSLGLQIYYWTAPSSRPPWNGSRLYYSHM